MAATVEMTGQPRTPTEGDLAAFGEMADAILRHLGAEPAKPAGEVCRWRKSTRLILPWDSDCGQECGGVVPRICPGCGRRVEVK